MINRQLGLHLDEMFVVLKLLHLQVAPEEGGHLVTTPVNPLLQGLGVFQLLL